MDYLENFVSDFYSDILFMMVIPLLIFFFFLIVTLKIISVIFRSKHPRKEQSDKITLEIETKAATTATSTTSSRTTKIPYKPGMYKKRPFLLTKNELAFYRELLPAAKALNLTVMSKVRLADLIEPTEQTNFWPAFNRISAKHIDFVLCDNQYIRPMLAVELDDASHQRDDRDKRDIFVDNALEDAEIPILHTLSSANLQSKIDDLIPKRGKDVRMPIASPTARRS